MVEKIKKICFEIATLGSLGHWHGGSFLAMLLAIPVLFIFRALSWLSPTFMMLLIIVTTLFVLAVIQGALHHETDQDRSVIVIDRLCGALLVFIGIPLSIKIILIGLFLFGFLHFISPFLWYKLGNINVDEFPGVFGIIINDFVVGVILNLILRLVFWIAR